MEVYIYIYIYIYIYTSSSQYQLLAKLWISLFITPSILSKATEKWV